jgi:hypothetical protein
MRGPITRFWREDFLGVYPDGFAGREAHSDQLAAGPTLPPTTIAEEHIRPLGPTTSSIPTARATSAPARLTRRHARHLHLGAPRGGWINIFSQDTPLTGAGVP